MRHFTIASASTEEIADPVADAEDEDDDWEDVWGDDDEEFVPVSTAPVGALTMVIRNSF